VYRELAPDTPRRLPFGLLLDPVGDGTFRRACEADSWRALTAAVLGDPGYESAEPQDRVFNRLRLAEDARFLGRLVMALDLAVGDRDAANTINVSSDEALIRSLDRFGLVSLAPEVRGTGG